MMSLLETGIILLNWLQNLLSIKMTSSQNFAEMPVEIKDNHIYVNVQANDSRSLSLILDTGATDQILNTNLIPELGIKHKIAIQPENVGTGENTAKLFLTKNIGLNFNGILFQSRIFVSFENLEKTVGHSVDGILGVDVFKRYVVKINYPSQTVSLYPSRTYEYTGEGTIIPLTFINGRPFVNAWIQMPGQKKVEGKFVLDIGDNSAISLHTPFVKKHDLLSYAQNTILHTTQGITGESREFLGRIPSLQLGNFLIRQPIVAFSQAEKGSKADKSYDGAIGGEILRRFMLTFDYSRKHMILESNSRFDEPFEVDMSGLVLKAGDSEFKTIKIKQVLPNSPAAECGLVDNDELIVINEQTTSSLNLEQLKQMLKTDSKEYRLSIRRGDQVLNFKLKTRRLV